MQRNIDFLLYTDGSCLVNPGGSGGYGIVLIDMSTGEVTEKSEGFFSTTNNRMEVMAAIEGLKMAPEGSTVQMFSDSQYLVKTLDGYFDRKKNLDLWAALDCAMKGKEVLTKWVRGHAGNPYNEKCDGLAMGAACNPTLEDKGYRERKPARKDARGTENVPGTINAAGAKAGAGQAGMPAWERIPAPGGADYYGGPKRAVNCACAASIRSLNGNAGPRFKDFVSLKTGGCDGWSSFGDLDAMVDTGTLKALEEILPSRADVDVCLRWYGRGLKFSHCIRKALTDAEVRENAAKSRASYMR